jgi:hypothetical protein
MKVDIISMHPLLIKIWFTNIYLMQNVVSKTEINIAVSKFIVALEEMNFSATFMPTKSFAMSLPSWKKPLALGSKYTFTFA